jgi:hypothetical protein
MNDRAAMPGGVRYGVMLLCLTLGMPLTSVVAAPVPSMGYIYPAGAACGTKTRVLVGGQYLRNPKRAIVSGKGVSAEVVEWLKPMSNINREQRWLIMNMAYDTIATRLQEEGMATEAIARVCHELKQQWPWTILKNPDFDVKEETLPKHPMLLDMSQQSIPEIWHSLDQIFFPRQKLQLNRQLAEWVIVDITVDDDASEGIYEIRLQTAQAITKPLRFQVSALPELREQEPNHAASESNQPKVPELRKRFDREPATVPFVLNGQIMPGDVDVFHFSAAADDALTIKVFARELIPYLADAVPGWFQAVVTLRDADGHEIAYADDDQFNPDPVLNVTIPHGGIYALEIRDAIYRGRQDFVYRVAVQKTDSHRQQSPVDVGNGVMLPAGMDGIRRVLEDACNNSPETAQGLTLPALIVGSIEESGDQDWYHIEGAQSIGSLAVEVYARRLGSPLDSVVRVMDQEANVLAWNDDYQLKLGHLHVDELGTLTHHADSVLLVKETKEKPRYVQVSDVCGHGGAAYQYMLRISEPEPDFVLRVTPSAVMVKPGGVVPMHAYVMRKDGADSPIDISLVDAPEGFVCSGARIEQGKSDTVFTLRAPGKGSGDPIRLQFEGRMRVGGRDIVRQAKPADDTMQAFLWRHLVPARDQLCMVANQKWSLPRITLAPSDTVSLAPGRSAVIQVNYPRKHDIKNLVARLDQSPAGISLSTTLTPTEEGFSIVLTADPSCELETGIHNVLIQLERQWVPKRQAGDSKPKKKRSSPFTYLPVVKVNWQDSAKL